MILSMSEQAEIFLTMVLAGMGAGLIYDVIRVVRRLIKHSMLIVQMEDLIYWLLFTIGVMLILLWEDNGALRVFSVAAPIIGMIIYFCTFSRLILVPVTALALFIKKIFMVILHTICLPMEFIGKLCALPVKKVKKILYKFNKIAKKLLKKFLKCEKIINRFSAVKFWGLSKANGSDKVEGRRQKK